jgi:hypothetical protein
LGEIRGTSHQSADQFAEGPGTSSAGSVKALNSFSVAEVAVVADVPLCVSCGAHAEFSARSASCANSWGSCWMPHTLPPLVRCGRVGEDGLRR